MLLLLPSPVQQVIPVQNLPRLLLSGAFLLVFCLILHCCLLLNSFPLKLSEVLLLSKLATAQSANYLIWSLMIRQHSNSTGFNIS